MFSDTPDFQNFTEKYSVEEKEILLLTGDKSGGAVKVYDFWAPSQPFLAFIDLETNKLTKADGTVKWAISEEHKEEHGIQWPYFFEHGSIYHLKVRELIEKPVFENGTVSFYNRFMVIEMIADDLSNDELEAILEEYRKPVELQDEKLGTFKLEKDYDCLEGFIKWLGKDISVSLEVDSEDEDTWKEAMEFLYTLHDDQEKHDAMFCDFAADQLMDQANGWLEEGGKEITKSDFKKRIFLQTLNVTCDGDITAHYNDDDMFYGHIISISGDMEDGLQYAAIEG